MCAARRAAAAPSTVEFHLDPLCPFAYQTSLWIREVRAQAGVEIAWRFFSLEEVNWSAGHKHPWERTWSYGWSLMRIGAALRRRDMALLDAWYERVGRALHVEGRKAHHPTVARQLLADIGVSPDVVDEALADPTTGEDVWSEHQRVVAAGGFGVPTLFFPDGQCLFGPVLVDPPRGAAALRLWEAVVAWTEFPHLYELQRPKSGVERQHLVDTFQPYLAARDWVSVNRGKVVDLGDGDAGDVSGASPGAVSGASLGGTGTAGGASTPGPSGERSA